MKGANELVTAIGLEASLKLIAAWGGTTVYIPDVFNPESAINVVLGEESALKLGAAFGGEIIVVPKLNLSHIKLEVNVWKMVAKGFSIRETAHMMNVSVQRARQIIAKRKPKPTLVGDPGSTTPRGAADPRKAARDKKSPTSYQSK